MKSVRMILILAVLLVLGHPYLIAQDKQLLNPAMQSLILPGWGERSLDSRARGLLFSGTETGILIFTGLSWLAAEQFDNDMRHFAAEHAGVIDIDSKDDKFLDRLADYDNMIEYNEQMLRNRRNKELYSASQNESWDWETNEYRLEYQDIKLDRYRWSKFVEFSLGAIALNHLISAMDALYLERTGANLQVQPTLSPGTTGIRLSLNF